MQRVEEYCRGAELRFCPEIKIYNINSYEFQVLNFLLLRGIWNQASFEQQIKEQLLAMAINSKKPDNRFLYWLENSLLLLYVWHSTISATDKDYISSESFISYIRKLEYTPFRDVRYNTSIMVFDFYKNGRLKIHTDPMIDYIHEDTEIDLYSDNLLTLAYDYILMLRKSKRLKEQSSQQVFPSNVG